MLQHFAGAQQGHAASWQDAFLDETEQTFESFVGGDLVVRAVRLLNAAPDVDVEEQGVNCCHLLVRRREPLLLLIPAWGFAAGIRA